MDTAIPEFLADLNQENLNFFLLPPKRSSQRSHDPAFDTRHAVLVCPLAEELVSRVCRPCIRGPLYLFDMDIDESDISQDVHEIRNILERPVEQGGGLSE